MQHFDSIADTAKKTDKASLEGKQGQPQKPYILLFDFSIVLAAWTDSTKNRYKRLSNILSKVSATETQALPCTNLKILYWHISHKQNKISWQVHLRSKSICKCFEYRYGNPRTGWKLHLWFYFLRNSNSN